MGATGRGERGQIWAAWVGLRSLLDKRSGRRRTGKAGGRSLSLWMSGTLAAEVIGRIGGGLRTKTRACVCESIMEEEGG